MSTLCKRTFTLNVADDMALDSAVYANSPAAGGAFIFAVRGGTIFKLNATTGVKVSSSNFAYSVYGNSCICYDSVNDRIIVGCWNEWGAWEGSADGPGKGLFKINPSTLASEFHLGAITSALSQVGDGVLGVVASGGIVYGRINQQFGNSLKLFTYNPATNAAAILGLNHGNAIMPGNIIISGTNLFVGITTDGDMASYDTTTGANTGGLFFLPYSATSTVTCGICVSGTGNIYCTDRSILLYKLPSTLASSASISLGAGNLGAINCRCNSVDGLIYIPTPATNSIVVLDPSTDTVSSVKTGFDLPHDVVFTPTKKFAIQHGVAGLKEIV